MAQTIDVDFIISVVNKKGGGKKPNPQRRLLLIPKRTSQTSHLELKLVIVF